MTREYNNLYTIITIACLGGYAWLFMNEFLGPNQVIEVCLVKGITDIPCPSCGTTRSISALMQGQFAQAFNSNPLGYLVAVIMLLAPAWIFTDLLRRKKSFLQFYRHVEHKLKSPLAYVPVILIIVTIWIWNIWKQV